MHIISENIKQRRMELGYSTSDVAQALNLKEYEYERYEIANVQRRINPRILAKLAHVLQCSISDFMDWSDDTQSNSKEYPFKRILTLYDGRTYQISDLSKEAQDELGHFIEYLTEKYSAK